ncbi:MAG: hypothetical protein IH624_11620 [Phycisphaerae bacterium]|nr:hypothetical protein [Phycisphaerae bacterium]
MLVGGEDTLGAGAAALGAGEAARAGAEGLEAGAGDEDLAARAGAALFSAGAPGGLAPVRLFTHSMPRQSNAAISHL